MQSFENNLKSSYYNDTAAILINDVYFYGSFCIFYCSFHIFLYTIVKILSGPSFFSTSQGCLLPYKIFNESLRLASGFFKPAVPIPALAHRQSRCSWTITRLNHKRNEIYNKIKIYLLSIFRRRQTCFYWFMTRFICITNYNLIDHSGPQTFVCIPYMKIRTVCVEMVHSYAILNFKF